MTKSKIRDRIRRLKGRYDITMVISCITAILLFKAIIDFGTLYIDIFIAPLLVESVYLLILNSKIREIEKLSNNLD